MSLQGKQISKPRRGVETAEVVGPCIKALHAMGIPAWRNNTGVARFAGTGGHRSERFVRYGVPGASDILGVIPPSGRFLAVECKTQNANATQRQADFLDRVTEAGGVAGVVHSVEELLDLVCEARRQ